MEVASCQNDPISPSSCRHVNLVKNEAVLKSYKLLHAFYVSCIKKNSFRKKANDCVCNVHNCPKKRNRVHACLSCIYFGCFGGHIQSHAAQKNHPLAIDTDSGQLYCAFCADYKYDSDFVKIDLEQNFIASSQRSLTTGRPYKWEPTPDEIYLLSRHEIVYDSQTGVRGFVNINNTTCYLNSVIQCLIHAPIFRNYLLSMRHLGNDSEHQHQNCFICSMSNILQESLSGEKKALVAAELLCLLFKRANIFAQNGMQDAHECFVHLLDFFHKDETKRKRTETKEYSLSPCECIIHSIFQFQFRMERTCNNKCNPHVTNLAEESRWDITLDKLPESSHVLEIPFEECLSRSLSDWRDEYFCPECDKNVGCIIRTIPKKLPHIMNFCITPSTESNAIMTYKQALDMSSYMLKTGSSLEYQYYLFAIVEYIGDGNLGHYKCYVKKHEQQQWILCNDKEITPVTDTESITNVKARILFYHRTHM